MPLFVWTDIDAFYSDALLAKNELITNFSDDAALLSDTLIRIEIVWDLKK